MIALIAFNTQFWQGPVACDICGYGTPGHDVPRARAVIEIEPSYRMPVVAMECPECGHMSLDPIEEESCA